jgi:hypothetical protein
VGQLNLFRGALTGVDGALGQIGAQAERLLEVLHNGRNDVQHVWFEEGDQIIRILGSVVSKTTRRQVGSQAIRRSSLNNGM